MATVRKHLVLNITNQVLAYHDPQGLIKLGAPLDEYNHEAECIYEILEGPLTDQELAGYIYDIFVSSFDKTSTGLVSDYLKIANDILTRTKWIA